MGVNTLVLMKYLRLKLRLDECRNINRRESKESHAGEERIYGANLYEDNVGGATMHDPTMKVL